MAQTLTHTDTLTDLNLSVLALTGLLLFGHVHICFTAAAENGQKV